MDSIYFVLLHDTCVGFAKVRRQPYDYEVTDLLTDGEKLLCIKVSLCADHFDFLFFHKKRKKFIKTS